MASSSSQQGVDIGSKLIGEYVNEAYALSIEAHNRQLECRASIEVFNTAESIPPAELISILRNHKITETVDLEQVAIFCTEAAQGQDPQDFILAKATEAIPGEDGWFELIVATGKEESDLVEDEFGRVDFKSVQSFSNVEPGQHIGTNYLPKPGLPGKTITGETIPPKAGKPSGVIAGNGVRFNDDGTQAIAEKAGRAIFENKVLSIAEEFVVTGNVDLSIGHITFNGFVDIKGDVLDDFNITATKGINVTGAVGACNINCDGPVTIGTMTGMGTGTIVCKGTLQARYLNQVKVECWGDVNISHEIRNSVIKTTGSLNTPNGLITGGEVIALEGVEAKMLGARAGAKTHVTSGVYFPETDRLQFLRTRVKSVVEQIKRIGDTLKTLNKKPLPSARAALREAIELRIGILTQRQVNLDAEREELAEELLEFTLDEHPTANPKINVLGSIKERVVINLGETSEETTRDMSGPVSIIENTKLGGLRYLSYSPLKIGAENIEAEVLLEEEKAT